MTLISPDFYSDFLGFFTDLLIKKKEVEKNGVNFTTVQNTNIFEVSKVFVTQKIGRRIFLSRNAIRNYF